MLSVMAIPMKRSRLPQLAGRRNASTRAVEWMAPITPKKPVNEPSEDCASEATSAQSNAALTPSTRKCRR